MSNINSDRITAVAGEIACVSSTESNSGAPWPPSGRTVRVERVGVLRLAPGTFGIAAAILQRLSPNSASDTQKPKRWRPGSTRS